MCELRRNVMRNAAPRVGTLRSIRFASKTVARANHTLANTCRGSGAAQHDGQPREHQRGGLVCTALLPKGLVRDRATAAGHKGWDVIDVVVD